MENAKGLTISLYDYSHGLHSAYHGAGPEAAGDIVIRQLSALRSNSKVVVCLDLKPYKRSEIYDGYKAGRRTDPELVNIWDRTLQRVQDEGYQIASAVGEEADDVMATLAREYVVALCTDVRLVTGDEDISQCINAFTRWLVPLIGKPGEFEIRDAAWMLKNFGGEKWTERTKEPKQGPTPDQVALVKAIAGDTSDKIPGVKGIGITGAVFLVKTYKTLDAMARAASDAAAAAQAPGGKLSAFWGNYLKGMAEIPKWLRLTTVNDLVELERPALSYLEYVAPKPLVEETPEDDYEAAERAAIQGEPPLDLEGEVDWDQVAIETERRERAEMAASLPVGPGDGMSSAQLDAMGYPPQAPVGEPDRDPKERRVAMAAEADKVFPLPAPHDPSKMVIGKDPKADEALRALKSNTPPGHGPEATTQAAPSPSGAASQPPTASPPAAAPSSSTPAQVVPRTQGPRKGDEIPAPADLVKVAAPSWALATQPSTANEMLAIAKVLFNSRLYGQFGSERGVFAVMALGREFGMGMAEALEAFHIVNDRPFPKAVWILSRAQRHPDCVWMMVTEADEKHATVKTKHREAGLLEYTYTIERARLAGYLTGKNRHNWETKPQEMLEARAISKGSRRWYPGATFGMHAFEEAHDQ